MEPISSVALKRLDLKSAVVAEARTERNLLPSEPSWGRIDSSAVRLADYLSNLLKSGFQPSPEVELLVRKPLHGSRPVPYWGILERVAYRALVSAMLKTEPDLDRSVGAYLSFVAAPVLYARAHPTDKVTRRPSLAKTTIFIDSTVQYVVQSDLTAFYQFIDHAILAEALLLRGADFELIQALVALLEEVQGRKYGLPQLIDSSDRLSDIYADIIERELLRGGLAVWRFNDDFRIACESYGHAINAIESLDASARRVGLVVAEHKTVTIGIGKYLIDNLGQSAVQDVGTISPDDLESLVGDYSDEFGEADTDAALAVICSARVMQSEVTDGSERAVVGSSDHSVHGETEESVSAGEAPWINLRRLRNDEIRLLRRALNGLAASIDSRAVSDVVRLAAYVPALMPNLMRYLKRVGQTAPAEVAEAIDNLIRNLSLNAWQRVWLVDLIRDLQLPLDAERGSTRIGWLSDQRAQSASPPLRAYATFALASAGVIRMQDVIDEADQSPSALLHIYTAAAFALRSQRTASDSGRADELTSAWAKSSVLHARLLFGDEE